MVLHVVTTTSTPTPCTGDPYLCTCEPCTGDREHAIALATAGARDRPQPWASLERAA